MLDVGRGHAAELGESARVEIDALEVATHGGAAAAAVVTGEAWHVVGRHDTLAHARTWRHAAPDLGDLSDHLVTENGGSLRPGLVDLQ